MMDLDIVGDFLVMAATLMQIKSRMLLPPDPAQEEALEEDPRDELVRRLLEYKKFKEIAEELREKETVRKDYFSRTQETELAREYKEDAKEIYFEASLFDLITAFSQVLKNVPRETFYQVIKEEHTVEQKIHDILHLLLEESKVLLKDLFQNARSRMEIIVIFMAILELIRLREIKAIQKRLFDDILIVRNKENMIAASDNQKSADEEEATNP